MEKYNKKKEIVGENCVDNWQPSCPIIMKWRRKKQNKIQQKRRIAVSLSVYLSICQRILWWRREKEKFEFQSEKLKSTRFQVDQNQWELYKDVNPEVILVL